ncbi:unnamed protein product [Rotaria sp. Silwood2]|nr:unnamed protein product [Rotaria sp. Silwood2]
MDTRNNDNYSASSGNISRISSTNTLITNSPRRSARLSSKSPQVPSETLIQSNIHRTVSGGVTNSRSPKLNNRKRNLFSGGRGDYSSGHSQISLNNNISTHHGNNHTTILHTNLPSDQSDDDEITSDSRTATQTKSTGLASRSEVLPYFEQQPDGFKYKICLKNYQASKFSDTNLRKHLSSSHKVPNVLFKSQINDNPKLHVTTISSERRRELHSAVIN